MWSKVHVIRALYSLSGFVNQHCLKQNLQENSQENLTTLSTQNVVLGVFWFVVFVF